MFKGMTTNLMVESVDDAIAFYQSVLEFEMVTSVPNKEGKLQFAILTKDGFNLMFQERTNLIEEYPCLSIDKVKPSITIFIMVDNFLEVYEDVKQKHPILTDIHKTFYETREFAINDIDGYVLTFAEKQ